MGRIKGSLLVVQNVLSGIISSILAIFPRELLEKIVKSFSRYLLASLITILAPIAFPGVAELVGFLQLHLQELAQILTIILLGTLGTWSVAKNVANTKLEFMSGLPRRIK